MQKKVPQVLFCDLHSAVVLADNVYETIGHVSWFTDFVGRLCRSSDIPLTSN